MRQILVGSNNCENRTGQNGYHSDFSFHKHILMGIK